MQIVAEIQLTESYGQFLGTVPANSRTSTGAGLIPRKDDFWRAFKFHVRSDEHPMSISGPHGYPNYYCSQYGGCSLSGATVEFNVSAAAFSSDSASITIDPPEGEQVTTEFDLTSLR